MVGNSKDIKRTISKFVNDRKNPEQAEIDLLIARMLSHELGSTLPEDITLTLGSKVEFFLGMEDAENWIKKAVSALPQTNKYSMSKFLVSQIYIMHLLTSYLGTKNKNVYIQLLHDNVIKKVEEIENAKSSLSKHQLSPLVGKTLKGYDHSHVELIPSDRMEMYSKSENMKHLVESLENNNMQVGDALDILDNDIKSGFNKARKSTGSWLMSKKVSGKNIYLAIMCHPSQKEAINDELVYKTIKIAEKYLD